GQVHAVRTDSQPVKRVERLRQQRQASRDVRIDVQGHPLLIIVENYGRGFYRVGDEMVSPFCPNLSQVNGPIKIGLRTARPVEQRVPVRPMTSPPAVAAPVKQPAGSHGRSL